METIKPQLKIIFSVYFIILCHKRSLLKLQKMADFYYIPKAKIGWSFENLIVG
jgi:hypothetical protein